MEKQNQVSSGSLPRRGEGWGGGRSHAHTLIHPSLTLPVEGREPEVWFCVLLFIRPAHRNHKPIYYRGPILLVADRFSGRVVDQLRDRPGCFRDDDRAP